MKRLSWHLLVSSLTLAAGSDLRADTVVVFNEVMYHPATSEPTLEWVELHNQMAVNVDISDWSITGGINYTFPANTVVAGGGYLVVAVNPAALAAATGLNPSQLHGPFLGRLSNNGETLELRNNSGRIVDRVSYGVDGDWPVGADGAGVSLAKRDRESASGPALNWSVSEQLGGTPGAKNFLAAGDPPPPDTPLLEVNAAWKYDASGADLGTAWRAAGFNDSAWPSRVNLTRQTATGLFSTGLNAAGTVLAPGNSDPHYIITVNAQGAAGAVPLVMTPNAAWLANDAASTWIGAVSGGGATIAGGSYFFQTTFPLNDFLLSSVEIQFRVSVDNTLNSVGLNGVTIPLTFSGFGSFSGPMILNSGFVSGINTLEFRTVNEGAGPGGFRALLSGSGLIPNTASPLPPGPTTYYFRTPFTYVGDVGLTTLKLNPILADGAVVYLNGVEVYRQNMPAGAITAATPALSNVGFPSFSGQTTIPSASLVSGNNVLAVEVHQASGSPDAPLLGAVLAAGHLPPPIVPPVTVAFNEVAAAGSPFFAELINYGSTAQVLDGCVLKRDGATDSEYVLPATTLAPGQYLNLSGAAVGFAPAAGDKLLLLSPNRAKVIAGAVVTDRLQGRWPEGTGSWLNPVQATPGAANSFGFQSSVVINEIMYHHRLIDSDPAEAPRESPEEWVELYNQGPAAVNLEGWELDGGIRYRFGPGRMIAVGAYLVVAADAAALRARFPAADITGDYSGQLSNQSNTVRLNDPNGNPADEVRYMDGGRWPDAADGGGSSLELRDPKADNSKAEAWAASDESGASSWQTYSYTAEAKIPPGSGQPLQWNDFIMGLLADGECLVDDISVVEAPDTAPVQFIANGNFESGEAGWRVLGTHGQSRVEVDPDNAGNHVLHVVATGAQEHMHNHIETTYTAGRTVANGRLYQISYRARWLAGNNLLNTRLYFNRAARSTTLLAPSLNGTPGRQNSRFAGNIGPTFASFSHAPVIPQTAQAVTVSVTAQDPQGVASAVVWWSVSGGPWSSAPMTSQGNGAYVGSIPGQGAGAVVQFYVEAADGLGVAASFPAAGRNSGALYAVNNGEANFSQGHNLRILLTPANTDLLHALTNVMSNARLPGTVIYDEHRAYYDVGVRLKGSERGRFNDTRTSFHLTFPPDDLFRGVHPVMLVDRSGAGDSPDNKQKEIMIKHILHRAGGIPGTYADMCRVIAPRSVHTGSAQLFPRNEDEFIETAYDNGGDGDMWELELIYFPTTANSAGYKLPSPDGVVGTDIGDLGDDKEIYRYNFIPKKERGADNQLPFVGMAKSWSLNPPALEQQAALVMDMDQWTRAYALVSLCGVNDMYTFGNHHNALFYQRPSDGKMIYFPWDMDFSFNFGTGDSLIGNRGTPPSPPATNNLARVLSQPVYRRLLYAQVKDLIASSYNPAYLAPWATHYASFTPNQSYADVPGYVQNRMNAALAEIASNGGNTAFALTSLASVNTSGDLVTLTGTAPVEVRSIKVNGVEYPITWSSVSSWSLKLPVAPGTTVFTVTAYDLRGIVLPAATASVTVNASGPATDPAGWIVFNEIMYHPVSREAAYVELFNRSDVLNFDLSGWRVNGLDYSFPTGSVMTALQHLVLASDPAGYITAYGLNTPVPYAAYDAVLQNNGETLTLLRPGAAPGEEIVVDKVRYENGRPWPLGADGTGRSLQLIDPAQDNGRVANWSDGTGWREFSTSKVLSGSTSLGLLLALRDPGVLFVDDVRLVLGSVPGAGPNLLANGDFESGVLAPWLPVRNHSGTVVTTEAAYQGTHSLKIVATGPGSTTDYVQQNGIPGLVAGNTYSLSFRYLPVSPNALKWRLTSTFSDFQVGLDVSPILFTPGATNSTTGLRPEFDPVWLNEMQLDNIGAILDSQGEREPWIELFNSGSNPVSLAGYYLTDNYSSLTQWVFPAGASLQPGQYKVVFVDGEAGDTTEAEWHTSFRLNQGTGSVALAWSPGGVTQVLDYFNFSPVPTGRSYGDFPDGQPFDRQLFFFPTPGAPNNNAAPPLTLYINEWMASNTQSLLNTNGNNQFDDWFEIYNPGTQPANLAGYFLTDNLFDPFQFEIPEGYVVPPHGFLLVWADDQASLNNPLLPGLHTNFKLGQNGEQIGLFAVDGTLIDGVSFEPQFDDVSQGRFPDATSSIYYMMATTPTAPNSSWANRYPAIAPLPDAQIVAGQPYSVQVMGADLDSPPQVLSYSLDPGAPLGASINPAGGMFTWTPSPSQPLGTNMVTVRVTDNGFPILSVARTFKIEVVEGLYLSGLMRTPSGGMTFTVGTKINKLYRVEYTDSLDEPDWQPWGENHLADSASWTITIELGPQDRLFYRVVELP